MRSLIVLVVVAACGDNSSVNEPDAAEPEPNPVFAQTAYFKSVRTIHDAHFGKLALSGSGDTLVAGQPDSTTVYTHDGGSWAAAELPTPIATVGFGERTAISRDGSTIAVGSEDGVHLFRSDGSAWVPDGYLLGAPVSLALSSDGNMIVVGARNLSTDVGNVRTYERGQNGWSQVASLGGGTDDFAFGEALALASDGSVLAASVYRIAARSFVVEMFARTGSTWQNVATLSPPAGQRLVDAFETNLSCSALCETIIIGDTQPPPMAGESFAEGAGVAYVFAGDGTTWTLTETLAASNADIGDRFGVALAVSQDGSTIVVGARAESSAATGIDGDGANNSAPYAGAAYLFRRYRNAWTQVMYLKASNAESLDLFGWGVAVAADGTTIVVAAPYENGGSTGVDGDQTDNSQPYAGAIYAFEGTY